MDTYPVLPACLHYQAYKRGDEMIGSQGLLTQHAGEPIKIVGVYRYDDIALIDVGVFYGYTQDFCGGDQYYSPQVRVVRASEWGEDVLEERNIELGVSELKDEGKTDLIINLRDYVDLGDKVDSSALENLGYHILAQAVLSRAQHDCISALAGTGICGDYGGGEVARLSKTIDSYAGQQYLSRGSAIRDLFCDNPRTEQYLGGLGRLRNRVSMVRPKYIKTSTVTFFNPKSDNDVAWFITCFNEGYDHDDGNEEPFDYDGLLAVKDLPKWEVEKEAYIYMENYVRLERWYNG